MRFYTRKIFLPWTALALFSLVSFTTYCSAQTTRAPPTSTDSVISATHTITVGKLAHKFSPDTIRAEIGDVVEFHFYPANHSVVRAEYELPCIPYEMTGEGKQGFFGGFHPVDAVLNDPPKYTIRINDSAPIFFYCSAQGSCIDWGMVGAINPTSSSQLQRQQTLALDSSYQLNPGDPFPAESTPTDTPGPGFTGPSLPLISSPADVTRVKITPATIGGITVAVVGVLILVGIMVFYLGRIKMLKEEVARKNSTLLRGDLSTDPERGGDNMTQTTVSPHMASVTPIAGAVTPHNTTQESKTDNFFQPPGHLRFASPGPPPPTYDAHYYSNEIAATPYGAKERALHPVYRTEPSVAQLYAQAQMPRRNKSLRDLGGDV